MTRDELLKQITSEIRGWDYECDEDALFVAGRIRALLPPQPKLVWRGRFLFVGDSNLQVGEVIAHTDDKWDGFLQADVLVAEYVPTEQEARDAVEKAVRKALGWTND